MYVEPGRRLIRHLAPASGQSDSRPPYAARDLLITAWETSLARRPNILWHCTDQQRFDTPPPLTGSIFSFG